jgi:predicted transcriptional regulator
MPAQIGATSMTDRGLDFNTTMQGLENGLRVAEIATFSLKQCSPHDETAAVLDLMQETGFDQIPVRDDGQIVGILEGLDRPSGSFVRDAMRPLNEAMLVSASDSIGTLLPLLHESRYRLVVRHGGIAGIVTQSDLIKLPVRLFAFVQITHLEMLMSERIIEALPSKDQWMALLSECRQGKVNEKIELAKRPRLDPSPLEFTDFCDKRDILRKHLGLGQQFERNMKEVEELRNTLAHAGDYGQCLEDLQRFMCRLEVAKIWIGRLESSNVAIVAPRVPDLSED